MKQGAVLVLLGVAVALGLWLGWHWLRQQRNRPAQIALHLVLGIAGMECLLLLMRDAADGRPAPGQQWGQPAALALVLAVMAGFIAPVISRQFGRRPAAVALVLHALLAGSGFVLALAWLLAG